MPRTRADATKKAGERDRYVIESVDRALMLLELLAQHPDLGVTEIADRMDVSKTLAFRMLYTLERRDFVVRDSARRTSALGYKFLHLAEKVESHNLIVGATKNLMDELGTLCDEDVNLFVRIDVNSLCVAARPSVHQVRVYPQVGLRLDLHAGGASPLLLAHAPDDVREAVLGGELKKLTPLTLTDPAKLRQRLDRIRRDGFHISRGDVDRGAFSVAAPVYGSGGAVVAALCIAGPLSRLTPQTTEQHRLMVLDYASRMSKRLGGTRPASRDVRVASAASASQPVRFFSCGSR